MLWSSVGLAAVGLVILVLAGDALVRGAVNLGLRIGIPALIVSLTIVAFGTSAPELLVSVNAVLAGKPGLAIGNVVGSNIANVLLVLGLPAMIAAVSSGGSETRRSYLMMLAATVLFIGLSMTGAIGLVEGLVLLAALALMLADQFRAARSHRRDLAAAAADAEEEPEGADPSMRGWRIALYLALGLVGLPLGADLLVDNASEIAGAFGVSDEVIGLTLVAVGTSLPELATTVMAVLRGHSAVALGNVIGSNLFNLLGILGVAALFGTIPVDSGMMHFDLWVMLAAALILAPFALFHRNISRLWGVALTGLYALYVCMVLS